MLNWLAKRTWGNLVENVGKSYAQKVKLTTSSTERLLEISQTTTHVRCFVAALPQLNLFFAQSKSYFFKWWGQDFCSFSPVLNIKNELIKELYL